MLRSRLVKDGAWVLVGQFGSAVGVLVGIRFLTEFAPPDVFGAATLFFGAVTLCLGTLVTPVMQAALRYYPKYAGERVWLLRGAVRRVLHKRMLCFLPPLVLALPLLARFFPVNGTLVLLCAILLVLDGLRSFESCLLNAARRQRAYALLSLAEAWGRPLLAVGALVVLGVAVESVLWAYALNSALVLLVYYLLAPRAGGPVADEPSAPDSHLGRELSRYSLPLVPMAALGWVNGQGDRYLIGGMLGLEQAGIYAAVYGLMSRPFLMAAGTIELTLRPHYNELVVHGRHPEARRLLGNWLLLVALLVGGGFGLILVFDEPLIRVLLAEKYHGGRPLMGWIGGGYVLLSLSDVFVKACYAYGYTGRIFMIQAVGGVLGLLAAALGVRFYGLLGAAAAVPVSQGCMLAITIFAARVRVHDASASDPSALAMNPGKIQ